MLLPASNYHYYVFACLVFFSFSSDWTRASWDLRCAAGLYEETPCSQQQVWASAHGEVPVLWSIGWLTERNKTNHLLHLAVTHNKHSIQVLKVLKRWMNWPELSINPKPSLSPCLQSPPLVTSKTNKIILKKTHTIYTSWTPHTASRSAHTPFHTVNFFAFQTLYLALFTSPWLTLRGVQKKKKKAFQRELKASGENARAECHE